MGNANLLTIPTSAISFTRHTTDYMPEGIRHAHFHIEVRSKCDIDISQYLILMLGVNSILLNGGFLFRMKYFSESKKSLAVL